MGDKNTCQSTVIKAYKREGIYVVCFVIVLYIPDVDLLGRLIYLCHSIPDTLFTVRYKETLPNSMGIKNIY